jgi:hypothetical protein
MPGHADDQLLTSQHVYGIPAGQCPVLFLHRTGSGDLASAYLESFERI